VVSGIETDDGTFVFQDEEEDESKYRWDVYRGKEF
jgi:hypothetical protein